MHLRESIFLLKFRIFSNCHLFKQEQGSACKKEKFFKKFNSLIKMLKIT